MWRKGPKNVSLFLMEIYRRPIFLSNLLVDEFPKTKYGGLQEMFNKIVLIFNTLHEMETKFVELTRRGH